jgi:putative transposase
MLPLTVDEHGRHALERRFAAANTLTNGMVQEALRALDACRDDSAWRAARSFPAKTKLDRAARSAAFEEVRAKHGLTEKALCDFERTMREGCWIDDHMTARLGHVIVKQVLKSIDGHLYLKRGRPAFRRADDCRTISARQASPMILKGSADDGFVLHWSGLKLPIRRGGRHDPFSEAERYSLGCRIVHCRVKRIPSGKVTPSSPWRYAVQAVVEGETLIHRPRAESGVAGLDTGPSMVGVVWRDGPEGAGHVLMPLAAEVERDEAAIRRSSRALDRQRRVANPHCFDDRGRWRKGQRIRYHSNRHVKEMASRRRRDAKATEHRRNCHGRDTNLILEKANEVRYEGHGFRGWTALWGRQMGRGAPGMFISELSRKCLVSGGSVVIVDHWKAALSQVDVCGGGRSKKPLRQRHHELGDGLGFVQRDLHSALLASHCDAAGIIDSCAAKAALEASCQGLVRSTAAEAAGMAEAARAAALPTLRTPKGVRWSCSNESREVPLTRETCPRRHRRRDWLRGRIAIRQAQRDGLTKVVRSR